MVAASGGLMGAAVVVRWSDNMTKTAKIVPGERVFRMPAGVVPRGGDLVLPKEARDRAAKQPNPIKVSEASVASGRQDFQIFCVPCHGPEAKGWGTGPAATQFIPPPDLTHAPLPKERNDR